MLYHHGVNNYAMNGLFLSAATRKMRNEGCHDFSKIGWWKRRSGSPPAAVSTVPQFESVMTCWAGGIQRAEIRIDGKKMLLRTDAISLANAYIIATVTFMRKGIVRGASMQRGGGEWRMRLSAFLPRIVSRYLLWFFALYVSPRSPSYLNNRVVLPVSHTWIYSE